MPLKGQVVWFSKRKGFGFIHPCDNSKDLFVHYSGILDNAVRYKVLLPDDMVEFDIQDSDKGRIAINVRVVSGSKEQSEVKEVEQCPTTNS